MVNNEGEVVISSRKVSEEILCGFLYPATIIYYKNLSGKEV